MFIYSIWEDISKLDLHVISTVFNPGCHILSGKTDLVFSLNIILALNLDVHASPGYSTSMRACWQYPDGLLSPGSINRRPEAGPENFQSVSTADSRSSLNPYNVLWVGGQCWRVLQGELLAGTGPIHSQVFESHFNSGPHTGSKSHILKTDLVSPFLLGL